MSTRENCRFLDRESGLLERFLADVESAGLVGEQENAVALLLVAVSALLDNPLSATVQGESSAGKNYVMDKVAAFLPPEMHKFLSGMSPKALMHAGEDEFEHKAVFIAEYEGVRGADYAIRTFQSERCIEWHFVESSDKGISKKKKRVRGPAAFIQATTRAVLHPENETRLLFLQVDESTEQTEAIIRRQAREAAEGEAPPDDAPFKYWHELIRGLKHPRVCIPYAQQVGHAFPKNKVRSRRDFPRFLGLVEACAFLHQQQRVIEDGQIIANGQDYLIAKRIFEHSYATGPDAAVKGLLDAAGRRFAEADFRIDDLMPVLGWQHSKTYDVLGRARELGLMGEGQGRATYRLLRSTPEPNLPLPESVEDDSEFFRVSAYPPPDLLLSEPFTT